jgi:hypothetical protein
MDQIHFKLALVSLAAKIKTNQLHTVTPSDKTGNFVSERTAGYLTCHTVINNVNGIASSDSYLLLHTKHSILKIRHAQTCRTE